jgi:periplasmic protein TonB
VAATELAVNPAPNDRGFGAALVLSLVIHLGAMTLSPSGPKMPSFNPPLPLSVHLVQEPAHPAELVRPARQVATKAAPVKRTPVKREVAVPAVEPAPPPVETVQTAQPPDASGQEPVVAPPTTAALQSAPETISLLAPPPLLRLAPSAEALSDYTRSLSKALDRYKEYPRIAELRGWEGSVTMRLRVAPSGRLIEAQVYKSSGFAVLDQQAVAMVSKAGVLPVPPEGLDAAEVPVLVPINFRLER